MRVWTIDGIISTGIKSQSVARNVDDGWIETSRFFSGYIFFILILKGIFICTTYFAGEKMFKISKQLKDGRKGKGN